VLAAGLLFAAQVGAADSGESLEYQPYVLSEGEGIPNGRIARLKATGTSTRGQYSVLVRGPYPTAGPEAHTHSHMFEAWYILGGALKFMSRDRVWDAPAGSFVFVPPAVQHRFWTEPGVQVKVVQIFAPPGFEKYFDERAALPSYDAKKTLAEQSDEWKRAGEQLARKYGAGPADHVSTDPPVIMTPARSAASRSLVTFEMTGGRYSLDETTRAPTAQKATATSRFDEAWLVISGELLFEIKDSSGQWQQTSIKPGAHVFVPGGAEFGLSKLGGQPVRLLHWKSNATRQELR
jgi:mannose-6-phosphate isomerase-like protein (cupin superfamily)